MDGGGGGGSGGDTNGEVYIDIGDERNVYYGIGVPR